MKENMHESKVLKLTKSAAVRIKAVDKVNENKNLRIIQEKSEVKNHLRGFLTKVKEKKVINENVWAKFQHRKL